MKLHTPNLFLPLINMSDTNNDIEQMNSSFNNFISDMRIIDDTKSSMKHIIDKVSDSEDINDILSTMNSIMECKKRIQKNSK